MEKFGEKLREYRKRAPFMSQEKLANKVEREKMTISLIEQGKNDPPIGELLENIISALELSEHEAKELRYLSALSRGRIPEDVQEYFYENPSIYDAIRIAKKNNYNNQDWQKVICFMEQGVSYEA